MVHKYAMARYTNQIKQRSEMRRDTLGGQQNDAVTVIKKAALGFWGILFLFDFRALKPGVETPLTVFNQAPKLQKKDWDAFPAS